ncbi:hypothetical protein BpHYR1_004879 [Brachionus plicatilis]|uniref:Uncharacterized protein n=1 Tax=Brachionus plicatilis TaxID=10195 RepID=A0A3M7T642_BRAPC|nr:hypothetical protein BpHYR1_004879 [Brachionus plicatilis]
MPPKTKKQITNLKNINASLNCFDNSGRYKGFLLICKELNLINENVQTKDISLDELRNLISQHTAFGGDNTRLEQLAMSFDNKVIFCPKFHCELNPVEGVFCDLKHYLWNRFWEAIEMYNYGASYQEVFESFFGTKSSSEISWYCFENYLGKIYVPNHLDLSDSQHLIMILKL